MFPPNIGVSKVQETSYFFAYATGFQIYNSDTNFGIVTTNGVERVVYPCTPPLTARVVSAIASPFPVKRGEYR